ncbi:hypothetical protein GCM10007421_14830 [Halopseudomonas oceani]|nr:hypothetical protein GCM10007421_14830 [Halopseudomonas oceani]
MEENPIFACQTEYRGVGTLLAKMVVKIAMSAATIARWRWDAAVLAGERPDIFTFPLGQKRALSQNPWLSGQPVRPSPLLMGRRFGE